MVPARSVQGERSLPTAVTASRRSRPGLLLLASAAFAAGFGLIAAGHQGKPEADPPFQARQAEVPRVTTPSVVAVQVPASSLAPTVIPPPAVEPAPVALAAQPPAQPPMENARADLEVQRGDTLLQLLSRAGVPASEAHAAAGTLRQVADLRRMRAGQRLTLELAPKTAAEKRLIRLVWPIAAAREVHLVRADDGGFAARSVERPLQQELLRFGGTITDSLYQSAHRAGLPMTSLPQMVALLSWDLDLQRELHPGDRFETVLERRVTGDGELAGWGDLQFLAFESRERRLEAYRFATAPGRAEFYDRQGRALRKWLLRTPVDGARLSSNFGKRRHPVLGYTRMHKGIDFAAPTGTPILAAAAGVVELATRNRGYGRYVKIRHNDEYSTVYAHMSKLAPGLKAGRKVEQGTVIGAVGATGLATGPHLHYEVLQRGKQVDPLRLKAAYVETLRGEELRRFIAWRDRIDGLRHDRGDAVVAQRGG